MKVCSLQYFSKTTRYHKALVRSPSTIWSNVLFCKNFPWTLKWFSTFLALYVSSFMLPVIQLVLFRVKHFLNIAALFVVFVTRLCQCQVLCIHAMHNMLHCKSSVTPPMINDPVTYWIRVYFVSLLTALVSVTQFSTNFIFSWRFRISIKI